jgi:hypothetical protein
MMSKVWSPFQSSTPNGVNPHQPAPIWIGVVENPDRAVLTGLDLCC